MMEHITPQFHGDYCEVCGYPVTALDAAGTRVRCHNCRQVYIVVWNEHFGSYMIEPAKPEPWDSGEQRLPS